MVYQKLVRDKIPELIEAEGQMPIIRRLTDEEFTRCLEEKLDEEVREYHADKNLQELADIIEVVYALAESQGYSREELMAEYAQKHEARGGFSKRIFLVSKG